MAQIQSPAREIAFVVGAAKEREREREIDIW